MSRGETAATWWRERIAPRDDTAARGLAARLRRAGDIATLAEPAVQDLARRLGIGPAGARDLARLARLLAELREDDRATLATRLGGPEPVLSTLRFQRLLRARGEEFEPQLRRAIAMAERRANVARLAGDILAWEHPEWGDDARTRWCFDYFRAPAPENAPSSEESPA